MIRIDVLSALRSERSRLNAMARRLGNFQPLHAAAGKAVRGWVRRNYDARGALHEDFPIGWPPLAPSTLASRRRRGRGTKILEDSGRLRAGTVLAVDAHRAELSNPTPYAVYHQFGQGVPRRPIFPGERHARAIAIPAIVRHMEEILG